PPSNPQPMLQRAALLRQAVAREPKNPRLLLLLARAEFAAAQLAALRDYNSRFEGGVEPLEEQRVRYEAWLRGHLYRSRGVRSALRLARQAAAL
ncbi:hypothetical protein, partial [Vibrio parahaemolyticus]|uniref:hypothetical protein n=1 Tax=Vibrio parahaemolyticus TaxID=670 RepID=UPI002112682F